jgi:putative flippase GtrA
MVRKAATFALIGLFNTGLDALVFFAAITWLTSSLVAANVLAWATAVSSSYLLNTNLTFSAESGRVLRWPDYARFVLTGAVGMVAATLTLVVAAKTMPVWAAKALAILVSFVVNFALVNAFVYRRPRGDGGPVL